MPHNKPMPSFAAVYANYASLTADSVDKSMRAAQRTTFYAGAISLNHLWFEVTAARFGDPPPTEDPFGRLREEIRTGWQGAFDDAVTPAAGSFAGKWHDFRASAIQPAVPLPLVEAFRRVFYFGAWGLDLLLCELVDGNPPEVARRAGEAVVEELQRAALSFTKEGPR